LSHYTVEFVWKKLKEKKGELGLVSCNGVNIPGEETIGGKIANLFVQKTTSEMQAACSVANTNHVLSIPKGGYLYLDVGRWSKGIQNFGLVCGNQVILCDYTKTPSVSPFPNLAFPTTGLLGDFLRIPNVVPKKIMQITGSAPFNNKCIHVILPDMHVPASPPLGMPRPPSSTPNPFIDFGPKKWQSDKTIFDAWAERDLFQSRQSIAAMIDFLKAVVVSPNANVIKLTQVGDMYELWMKRPCLFEKKKPKGPPGVDMKNEKSATEVGEWIADTHELFSDLFLAFDDCKAKLHSCHFLHGNHDSYLSADKVVAEANRIIGERSQLPGGFLLNSRMRPSTVYQRTASGFHTEDAVFIEHGQRGDKFNDDGNADGHGKTQSAGGIGMMFDSTRRNSFVAASAALWLLRSRDFGIYAMGHTHAADLNFVEVTHKDADTDKEITSPDVLLK
jgi:hypothetical protein